jgi:SAM-dependent methyltransferase
MRVLELGGGDGFQAHLLARLGCEVTSIDIAPRRSTQTFHPVQEYDGRSFPFPDHAFDATFSSNVLEHISDLPRILAELRRVCRPEGYGVHLVPSTSWRFWTIVTHYPWLVQRVLRGSRAAVSQEPDLDSALHRNSPLQFAYKLLGLAPHGEHRSALSELYFFSRRRWRKVMKDEFQTIRESDNSLFYTGHTLFPDLSMKARQRLSRLLGPACHVFVVRNVEP